MLDGVFWSHTDRRTWTDKHILGLGFNFWLTMTLALCLVIDWCWLMPESDTSRSAPTSLGRPCLAPTGALYAPFLLDCLKDDIDLLGCTLYGSFGLSTARMSENLNKAKVVYWKLFKPGAPHLISNWSTTISYLKCSPLWCQMLRLSNVKSLKLKFNSN